MVEDRPRAAAHPGKLCRVGCGEIATAFCCCTETEQMQLRWKDQITLGLCTLLFTLAQAAGAQQNDAHGLVAELTRRYTLSMAKLSADGTTAIEPGVRLTVRREGIMSFAQGDQAMEEICPAEFRGGQLHAEKNALCNLTSAGHRRMLRVSDRVCVTAITASEEKDNISLYVVGCNSRGAISASNAYYARLLFQFPSGFLKENNATRVEEAIGQVLSKGNAPSNISSSTARVSAVGTSPAAISATGATPTSPQPMANMPNATNSQPDSTAVSPHHAQVRGPEEQAPTPSVSEVQPLPAQKGAGVDGTETVVQGQTIAQVKAILGEPERVADLGSKIIYFYPHSFKVSFVDGKVSAVQQLESNQ